MRSVLGMTMRTIALALPLAIPVQLGGPAQAQELEEFQEETPEGLAGEAMDRLMQALDLLIGSIPQYEAPYVNENGDIIIRRKHDDELPTPEEKPTPPAGEPDTTTT